MNVAAPAPGALAIVGGGDDVEAVARRGAGGGGAELFADAGIAVAYRPSWQRRLHAEGRIACLLEGALYELEGRPVSADDPRAAELLADAYARTGPALLPGLRGECWALLWDRELRDGVVFVDQLGSCCPYWMRDPAGRLLIGSDVRDLLAASDSRPAPEPLAVVHWVMSTPAPDGMTLFSGIRRLQAGHLLPLTGVATPRRYWTPVYRRPLDASREDLVGEIRAALGRSLRRRLGSGEGAGVLLSGGLDSSVVAAIAAAEGFRPHAYSAVFPDHSAVDESELIDRTVTRLRLPSTRIVVRGGSVLAGAAAYTSAWALPPASPNQFFWIPLLRHAATLGTRFVLDGEGGDEVFGLSPYLLADRLRRGRFVSALRLAQQWPPPFRESTPARVRLRLRRFGVKGGAPYLGHTAMRRLRGWRRYAPGWIAPELARQWVETNTSAYEWKRVRGPRWWASMVGLVTVGSGPALVYEQGRRRAALAGMSARHALVDVDLIELVLRVAPELLFGAPHSRPLLREAVAGLLPDEVRLRTRKSNFDAVFHAALAGRDLPAARRLLEDPAAELHAYFDLPELNRALFDGRPPTDPGSRQGWAIWVWRLLTAECWLRSEADPGFLEQLVERERLELDPHVILSTGAPVG